LIVSELLFVDFVENDRIVFNILLGE